MKKLYVLLTLLFLINGVFAQGCLPDGITFTTQTQIDSFHSNYPDCTNIEGDIFLGIIGQSSDITNLDGLSVLTSIGGNLVFRVNYFLTNITGLANLTSIGGNLIIFGSRLTT